MTATVCACLALSTFEVIAAVELFVFAAATSTVTGSLTTSCESPTIATDISRRSSSFSIMDSSVKADGSIVSPTGSAHSPKAVELMRAMPYPPRGYSNFKSSIANCKSLSRFTFYVLFFTPQHLNPSMPGELSPALR
jgi:hypothetical protein